MKHALKILPLLGLYPWVSGFVLLGATKSKLDVSPTQPVAHFVWDGNSPTIEEKDKFDGGRIQDLEDKQFFEELLKVAMGVWNDVPDAYVQLEVGEGADPSLDENDKQHSIVVEKSNNISTAAFAKPKVNEDDPEIIEDCDVSIADTKTTAKDLAYTIAHELGHCLGFGHAHTNYNAMMGYSRTARDMKLGADDMAGLIYLYPDPSAVPDEPKELVCGEVGAGYPKPGRGLLVALLLLPLALVFVRRRA